MRTRVACVSSSIPTAPSWHRSAASRSRSWGAGPHFRCGPVFQRLWANCSSRPFFSPRSRSLSLKRGSSCRPLTYARVVERCDEVVSGRCIVPCGVNGNISPSVPASVLNGSGRLNKAPLEVSRKAPVAMRLLWDAQRQSQSNSFRRVATIIGLTGTQLCRRR